MVDLLLKNGADIGGIDKSGETPLFIACRRRKTKVVNFLLSRGADIYHLDNNCKNIISISRENGYLDVVRHLRVDGIKQKLR